MKYSAWGEVLYKDNDLDTMSAGICDFTECFSWDNAANLSDVSKNIVCFRPEYVQKTVQNFTEQVDSW